MAPDVMVEPSGSPLPHASGGSQPLSQSTVLRTIGRWGLTAIVLNQIIGSGIFALPGTVAARLGWLVLPAHAIAALLALLIMLAFAEVASRFSQAGGPYLYAHAAFGRFVGLQMGWMAMFVRLLSAAVQVNLLTTYIAELWPPAGRPVGSAAIAAVFLGGLTVVNLLGVTQGTRVSSAFAALKIGALRGVRRSRPRLDCRRAHHPRSCRHSNDAGRVARRGAPPDVRVQRFRGRADTDG